MPTPPNDFVTSLRAGHLARHLLFRMDHSSGTVAAWNGIGELAFGGEVYKGVGGMGRVSGLVESRDLQNHEVTVVLSGVAFPALATIDQSIRGRHATITAVWINEAGAVVASRVMFRGFGDTMAPVPSDRAWHLVLTLRSPIADWADAPAQFYTPNDQQRLFASDTGFDYVPGLQNTTVTGWGPTAEGTGGYMVGIQNLTLSGTQYTARDSLSGALIGSGTKGHVVFTGATGGASSFWRVGDAFGNIWQATEQTSTTLLLKDIPGYASTAAGRCPVDVDGNVQTAAGSYIEMYTTGGVAGGGTSYLRKILPTPSVATGPTTTTIEKNSAVSDRYKLTGFTVPSYSNTATIIDNETGYTVRHSTGTGPYMTDDSGGFHFYTEEGTGTSVLCNDAGGSLMTVGGGNCLLDASGLILSPTYKRLVIAATPNRHLRIWK